MCGGEATKLNQHARVYPKQKQNPPQGRAHDANVVWATNSVHMPEETLLST